MDSGDIILTVGSTIVGGFVGGWTSWYFHRLATAEGGKTTSQLLTSDEKTRRLVNTLGHALKDAGFAIPFDGDGNLTRAFGASFSLGGGLRANVTTAPSPVYDRAHEQPPVET